MSDEQTNTGEPGGEPTAPQAEPAAPAAPPSGEVAGRAGDPWAVPGWSTSGWPASPAWPVAEDAAAQDPAAAPVSQAPSGQAPSGQAPSGQPPFSQPSGWPWMPINEAEGPASPTQVLPPPPPTYVPPSYVPPTYQGPPATAAGAGALPPPPPPPFSTGGSRWAEPPAYPPTPARPPVDRTAAWIVGVLVLMMISGIAGAGFATVIRHRSTPSASSSTNNLPFSPFSPPTFGNGNSGSGSSGSGNTGSGNSGSGNSGSSANGSSGSTTTGFNYAGEVEINSSLADGGGQTAGTGMLLDKNGNVLTNNHVINGAADIRVQIGGTGTVYRATVTGYDVTHDVAVLHLTSGSNFTPIKLGDSSTVNVGDRVVAAGNALGKNGPPTVVEGSVTDLDQTVTAADDTGGTETLYGMIQTDAQIQPGDSGGPLFDASGKVIGMITAGEESYRRGGPTAGFAIPINSAKAIADQIIAGQTTSTIHIGARGLLGVQLQPDFSAGNGRFRGGFGNGGSSSSGNGALVAGVQSGSPASSAGISEGDVIVAVNGKTVSNSKEVGLALNPNHPGDKVSITWRDSSGNQHSATVKLIAGPPA